MPLDDLKAAGTNFRSRLKGHREAWLATTAGLSPQGLAKKKKEGTATSTIRCCSHSPGNTPALQLPLPNALGGAQILGHWTLQLGAAGAAPPVGAKQDEVLLAWSTGGGGKPLQLSLAPEVGVACYH